MRRLAPVRHSRARRGVAFIWFVGVAMPFLFLASAMSVDFTRIILASRQVGTAAQAAALAGAYQFTPGMAAIDPQQARQKALETYCVAQDNHVLSMSQTQGQTQGCPAGGAASVTVEPIVPSGGGGVTQVQVTARWQVRGLLFFGWFQADNSYVGTDITKTAAVCVPGQSTDSNGNPAPTGGFCARPSNR